MSVINPYNLTIHDLLCYVDSLAIKEEIKLLLAKKTLTQQDILKHQRDTRAAQLLLRLVKQSAIERTPNTFLSLLNELPE